MLVRTRAFVAAALLGCAGEPPTPGDPGQPHVELVAEGELTVIRLDASAVERLGLETAQVQAVVEGRTRDVGGVVTVPPGRAFSVTAPLAGTVEAGDATPTPGASVRRGDVLMRLVPFAPADRDLRAQTRRQAESTRARVEVATARLERTRALVEQRGASQRALEEAEAELATALAEDEAAQARTRMLRRSPLAADAKLPILAPDDGILRTLGAAAGQRVAAGALLFEVASTSALWVRVPVYPGDLERLVLDAPVAVHRLGADPTQATEAIPITAPPSADPLAISVDLFYALPVDSTLIHPGERVSVRLRYEGEEAGRAVPLGSVVYDFDGGAWIYECLDERRFRRRRIEVARQDDALAILRRGPAAGTCVVSVGALELLGSEFEVHH